MTDRIELAASFFPAIYAAEGDLPVKAGAAALGIPAEDYNAEKHFPMLVAKRCYDMADAFLARSGRAKNPKTFSDELRELINQNSLENESDTPDFILTAFLNECLTAYNKAVNIREGWYGRGTPASEEL